MFVNKSTEDLTILELENTEDLTFLFGFHFILQFYFCTWSYGNFSNFIQANLNSKLSFTRQSI